MEVQLKEMWKLEISSDPSSRENGAPCDLENSQDVTVNRPPKVGWVTKRGDLHIQGELEVKVPFLGGERKMSAWYKMFLKIHMN